MLSLREPRHGRVIMIVGPVGSGKKTQLEILLNSAHGTIWARDNKDSRRVVLAKHPSDDPDNPDRIKGYNALSTDNPDEIANLVQPETEAIIITGGHHFTDKKIVDLAHEAALSNRKVIITANNTDWDGKPIGLVPHLMALADEYHITQAPCSVARCERPATRSQRPREGEKGRRVCLPHHRTSDNTYVFIDQTGGLDASVAGMFASKTTLSAWKMEELDQRGIDYEVFKWIGDGRYAERGKEYNLYDNGTIGFNNSDKRIQAVLVGDWSHVYAYIHAQTGIDRIDQTNSKRHIGHIFIDEPQFLKGIADGVRTAINEGIRVYVAGLRRLHNMMQFGEMGELLCLASDIHVTHGYCEVCGRPSTESQRWFLQDSERKLWVPGHFDADEVVVGGKGEETVKVEYGAACADCLDVQNRPEPIYNFPYFNPPANVDERFVRAIRHCQSKLHDLG